MDIQYILSRNQASTMPGDARAEDPSLRPPFMGLLTKTVVRSPVIKWIFPARVRHKDKNDVILVRERSVEIKELVNRRHLQDVLYTSDMGCTIRVARVIGVPRVPSYKEHPNNLEDTVITDEDNPSPGPMAVDLDEAQILPPEILVMTIQKDSVDAILFFFTYHDQFDRVQSVSHQYPLPTETRFSRRFGKHLAVDPRFAFCLLLPIPKMTDSLALGQWP